METPTEFQWNLDGAQKPLLFCSFGKDSSCILHLLKSEQEWIDKTLVVFMDCGACYPDVLDFVHEQSKGLHYFFHFKHQTSYWDEVKEKGFPVDVDIPALSSFSGRQLGWNETVKSVTIRPWSHCLYERINVPMDRVVKHFKPDLVLTGERKKDRPFAIWENKFNGVQGYRPFLFRFKQV